MKYIKTYENFNSDVVNEELFGIGEVTLSKEEAEKYFNSDNNLKGYWNKLDQDAKAAWIEFMTTGKGLTDPKKIAKVLGEFVKKSKDGKIENKAYITSKYKYNKDKKVVVEITAEDEIFNDVQFKTITTNNEPMSAEEKAAWNAKIKEMGKRVTDSGVPNFLSPGEFANMFMYDFESKKLVDRPKDKKKELPKGGARIGGLASR